MVSFPALFDTPVSPRVRANAQTDRPQIEQLLAYLGGLRQNDGCAADNAALDQIAALLERAEAAERKAAAWEVAARRAERQLVQVQRRSRRATTRSDQQKTTQELARAAADVPYEIPTGACRVCGQPAPPSHRRRRDGLRVCSNRACRTEARRRDNNAKQRRYNERQQLV
jgi:recombinational DNA repair protein (RecF pathway)